MKSIYLKLFILLVFVSCKEEKLKSNIVSSAIKDEFSIRVTDTFFQIQRPINRYERSFKELGNINVISSESGTSRVIFKDSFYVFTENTTFEHRHYDLNNTQNFNGFIEKIKKSTLKHIGYEGKEYSKIELEIFSFEPNVGMSKKSLLNIVSYSDELELIIPDVDKINESYYITTRYGCCTNKDTHEIIDIEGNIIMTSNDIIKKILIDDKPYYFGVIQNEYHDSPLIHIKYPDNSDQFILIENKFSSSGFYDPYVLNVKRNETTTGNLYYNIKHIDSVEILFPFNTSDTLKIPFKSGKPFGKIEKNLHIFLE